MVREKIERIRSNVTSSVLVFQCASDGYVPFYVVDKIDRVNGMISISVAVAIGQKIGLDDEIELRQYLQRVADFGEFDAWYFGHFHEDTEVEDMFYCLYDDVVVL